MNSIICGDAQAELKKLPAESVDLIVTSSPYYASRHYSDDTIVKWTGDTNCTHTFEHRIKKAPHGEGFGDGRDITTQQEDTEYDICIKCGEFIGELGQEPTPDLFVEHLMVIFRECKRVLKKTGNLYLNIGDSYIKQSRAAVPARLQLAFLKEGWLNPNDIIWYKPNHMPGPWKRRLVNSFEYIYHFAKTKKYYYNLDAIRVPKLTKDVPFKPKTYKGKMHGLGNSEQYSSPRARNLRPGYTPPPPPKLKNPGDTWIIPTMSYPGYHSAVFPFKVCYLPILAGCPPDGKVLDPFAGSGTLAEAVEILNESGTVPEDKLFEKDIRSGKTSFNRANRTWIMIEIVKDYIKLIRERVEKYGSEFTLQGIGWPESQPVSPKKLGEILDKALIESGLKS